MADFFAMGGYAWYVWMAYGAVALAIVVEILAVRARRKRAFDELRMSVEPPRPPSTAHARSAR
ncbi:MAG TPA: heme exporter protein CcmD [Casimicrobiaceae bacterium]|nr:heme exporter protein CcmD [Casimicrobiaceae bacterium]